MTVTVSSITVVVCLAKDDSIVHVSGGISYSTHNLIRRSFRWGYYAHGFTLEHLKATFTTRVFGKCMIIHMV